MGKALKKNAVEQLFVGIDVHKRKWHVTVQTHEVELFCGSIPGNWASLKRILDRYPDYRIQAVYEAGYFGFWLHDHLQEAGIDCLVTPPSLLPMEYGNRVKTDKRDSRKLSRLLSKGMLKRVHVPSKEERYHRQVGRRRRQLIRDRVRFQSRIKAELRFYGVQIPEPPGKWSQVYVENLNRIRFRNRFMNQSFKQLLQCYAYMDKQVAKQTKLLKELSLTAPYKERVKILTSIPGVGLITAMEVLLELQDVERFQRADQITAYVGLTPSQYSSADKIRMGRITRIGKNSLRSVLVEASWTLIRKDKELRLKYERIKHRAGGKRAIVAIARTLLIRMRRILLNEELYTPRLAN